MERSFRRLLRHAIDERSHCCRFPGGQLGDWRRHGRIEWPEPDLGFGRAVCDAARGFALPEYERINRFATLRDAGGGLLECRLGGLSFANHTQKLLDVKAD
jgi:hypothetical protein